MNKNSASTEILEWGKEAASLLPDGMKDAALLAYQAVVLNHNHEYAASAERLRKLRSVSYSREPYLDILTAKNEFALADMLVGNDPGRRGHISRAKAALSSYLSSDTHSRPESEIYGAELLKARADYILGHRNGVFMGIVDIPESVSVSRESIIRAVRVRGMKTVVSSDTSALLLHRDGGLFACSLEEPQLMVVAAVAKEMDVLETAEEFITLSHALMTAFSARSFYINGVMLSVNDVDEAIADMKGEAFPVWFFARGSEAEENGKLVLRAEGAESFGAKAICILGVDPADREEASNALSLILVYHVFSVSARRTKSFTINNRTYDLVSSDRNTVSYAVRKEQ